MAQQVGILIVGSLLWEEIPERVEWRTTCLRSALIPVRVPIRYGRKSRGRGDTYTMTIGRDDTKLGEAVVVPCVREAAAAVQLFEEARALWGAEDRSSDGRAIGRRWGCVGALFRTASLCPLPALWTAEFRRSGTEPISPVNADGLLGIHWPQRIDGQALEFDAILAATTKAEADTPLPERIADAWICQDQGHERYFFKNVEYGIRTPEDLEIWAHIKKESPPWLPKYQEAAALLDG